MTSGWYRTVLERLPEKAHILDVGIGTGTALFANEQLQRRRNITVMGVDYDEDYVKLCEASIQKKKLNDCVQVRHVSIYDYEPKHGEVFDAIYFSGSLMIMPDPVQALKHVTKMLKPDGKIYVTQTFETQKNALLEFTKPLLKFLTTIDFGQVTYENDFFRSFESAGLTVEENVPILTKGSVSSPGRSIRLVVGVPKKQ